MFNPLSPCYWPVVLFPAVAQVTPTALPASVATAVNRRAPCWPRIPASTQPGAALADCLELAADTDAQADSELARAQQMQALMADAPTQITALVRTAP